MLWLPCSCVSYIQSTTNDHNERQKNTVFMDEMNEINYEIGLICKIYKTIPVSHEGSYSDAQT